MDEDFGFDENDDFSFDNLGETDSDEFGGFGGFDSSNDANGDSNDSFGDGFDSGDSTDASGSGADGSEYIDGSYQPDIGGGAESFGDRIEPPSSKSKLMVIIGIGVALLLIPAIIFGVAGRFKGGSRVTMKESNSSNIQASGNSYTTNVSQTVVTDTGWTEIQSSNLSKGNKLSGDFTVTDIKHYSKKSKLSELELKSVVKGSISGLSGTYEIDIPYTNGIGLKVGDVFSIEYRMDTVNDCNIVYDITY